MRAALPFVLLLAACASRAGGGGEGGEREPVPAPASLPGGELHRTSRAASFDEMMRELEEVDVVYVGETHTNADHHEIQLRVLEHLAHAGRLHGIGMEMFQRTFQPVVTAYVEGEIDADALRAQTEWDARWGHPFDLYRPILDFAREWRIPIIALNVEDEIRRVVSEAGLDGLTAEQRASLPALDLDRAGHRAYLLEVYRQHLPPGSEPDEESFARFYLVQCLWEDVMADRVGAWFETAPDDGQIVVLAGSGHVANRYGIPDRVHTRFGRPYRTVVPVETEGAEPADEALAQSYADFVWFTK